MMRADSKAAVIVNEIRGCIANKMAESSKPAPVNAIRERVLYWAVHEKSPRWLPTGFADYNALIKSCDESSRASLADTKRFGPDEANWRWDNSWSSLKASTAAAKRLTSGCTSRCVTFPARATGTRPASSYRSVRAATTNRRTSATSLRSGIPERRPSSRSRRRQSRRLRRM